MSEDQLVKNRRDSIKIWNENGFEAYCNKVNVTFEMEDVIFHSDSLMGSEVSLNGRIMSIRKMGNAMFLDLVDDGNKIQLFVSKKEVENWKIFDGIDIGDIVRVSGTVMKTKVGELSVKVKKVLPLTKCLIAPAKNGGDTISDTESKYRRRYQDLIENKESRDIFVKRSLIIKKIRNFMDSLNFMEVETPILTPIRSGANAKPFTTHHNALDKDLYLRVAPELYLKRLVVGGFNKVFEIGKLFRNEGLSTRHNPEFTAIEYYQAYANSKILIGNTIDMFNYLLSDSEINWDEKNSRFSKNFMTVRMIDAVKLALNYSLNYDLSNWDVLGGQASLQTVLYNLILISPENKSSQLRAASNHTNGSFLFLLFEVFAEPLLTTLYRNIEDNNKSNPVFITGYPVEVSPLARSYNKEDQYLKDVILTDRFELFIDGKEIANGFSELNDPDEQANRFMKQLENRKNGDDESMDYDEDYIRALNFGLCPVAGCGIGVDRLVMLITNQKCIRDVILFPAMK